MDSSENLMNIFKEKYFLFDAEGKIYFYNKDNYANIKWEDSDKIEDIKKETSNIVSQLNKSDKYLNNNNNIIEYLKQQNQNFINTYFKEEIEEKDLNCSCVDYFTNKILGIKVKQNENSKEEAISIFLDLLIDEEFLYDVVKDLPFDKFNGNKEEGQSEGTFVLEGRLLEQIISVIIEGNSLNWDNQRLINNIIDKLNDIVKKEMKGISFKEREIKAILKDFLKKNRDELRKKKSYKQLNNQEKKEVKEIIFKKVYSSVKEQLEKKTTKSYEDIKKQKNVTILRYQAQVFKGVNVSFYFSFRKGDFKDEQSYFKANEDFVKEYIKSQIDGSENLKNEVKKKVDDAIEDIEYLDNLFSEEEYKDLKLENIISSKDIESYKNKLSNVLRDKIGIELKIKGNSIVAYFLEGLKQKTKEHFKNINKEDLFKELNSFFQTMKKQSEHKELNRLLEEDLTNAQKKALLVAEIAKSSSKEKESKINELIEISTSANKRGISSLMLINNSNVNKEIKSIWINILNSRKGHLGEYITDVLASQNGYSYKEGGMMRNRFQKQGHADQILYKTNEKFEKQMPIGIQTKITKDLLNIYSDAKVTLTNDSDLRYFETIPGSAEINLNALRTYFLSQKYINDEIISNFIDFLKIVLLRLEDFSNDFNQMKISTLFFNINYKLYPSFLIIQNFFKDIKKQEKKDVIRRVQLTVKEPNKINPYNRLKNNFTVYPSKSLNSKKIINECNEITVEQYLKAIGCL